MTLQIHVEEKNYPDFSTLSNGLETHQPNEQVMLMMTSGFEGRLLINPF